MKGTDTRISAAIAPAPTAFSAIPSPGLTRLSPAPFGRSSCKSCTFARRLLLRYAIGMTTSPPVAEQKCPKCGGVLHSSVKHGYCITDIIGAALVRIPILLFIGLVFFDSGGPAIRFTVFLAGFLVFGLHHMVGRTNETIVRCLKCGESHEVQ